MTARWLLLCPESISKTTSSRHVHVTAAQVVVLCRHLRLDRHSARCQKALEHDVKEWHQHYVKEHHSLQALRAQYNDLRKNCTMQAANTKRVKSQAFCHILAVVPVNIQFLITCCDIVSAH